MASYNTIVRDVLDMSITSALPYGLQIRNICVDVRFYRIRSTASMRDATLNLSLMSDRFRESLQHFNKKNINTNYNTKHLFFVVRKPDAFSRKSVHLDKM